MRYRPDTCDCVIIQEHDREIPDSGITLHHVEAACEAHVLLTDAEIGVAVSGPQGENRRKNLARNRLQADFGVEPTWRFVGVGASRTLEIHVEGLVGQGRARAEQAIQETGVIGVVLATAAIEPNPRKPPIQREAIR